MPKRVRKRATTPCHIGGVAGPQERGKWPITAVKYHSQDDLLKMRPIVFGSPQLSKRLPSGAIEIQWCGIEKRHRHFAGSRLSRGSKKWSITKATLFNFPTCSSRFELPRCASTQPRAILPS
jgi:hypothetical protein